MNKSRIKIEKPRYKLIGENTLLFLTGAPLSGKSTIAPLITSSIEGLTLQPMDLIRLLAQEIDKYKPENQRSQFVYLGSCDSYTAIGDGKFTTKNLIKGYNLYSRAVTNVLTKIVPKLEKQGVKDLLFEGVQLTPRLVSPYLDNNNRLIVVVSNKKRLVSNTQKVFGKDNEMLKRYSYNKLLTIQNEIIKQANLLPKNKVIYINNTNSYLSSVKTAISKLQKSAVIKD